MSQEKNTALPQIKPGLWNRITEALDMTKTGEIATRLQLTPSSVSDWKHGRTVPSLETLHEIAFYGFTTIEWLMYEIGPKIKPGDPDSFDPWMLPIDLRDQLEAVAAAADVSPNVLAQRLLIQALQDLSVANGSKKVEWDEKSLIALIRRVVKEELQERTSPKTARLPVVEANLSDVEKPQSRKQTSGDQAGGAGRGDRRRRSG